MVYIDPGKRSILIKNLSVSPSDNLLPPSNADVTSSGEKTKAFGLKEVYHYGNSKVEDINVDWVSDNVYWCNETSHSKCLAYKYFFMLRLRAKFHYDFCHCEIGMTLLSL